MFTHIKVMAHLLRKAGNEKSRLGVQRRREKGLCTVKGCKELPLLTHRICETHKHSEAIRNNKKNRKVKEDVFNHYGHVCAWPSCGITDSDMLSIDHVFDNGADDRKRGRAGPNLYRWIIRRGFPSGYQLLCHNHQWKKRHMALRGEQLPTMVPHV